ncbi:MAG: hypothetical protein KDD36_10880 [Flavobacteriales bacterium]|nr:hypothetical protein [Flavobacteriales bacterium]
MLFVANINGDATEKDGNGFISQLGTDGHTIKLEWATGLDAPKGMGLCADKLYVSDIEQVVEIDPETGTILHKYQAEGAKFLNDITIAKDSSVYISDMMTNRIYRLKNGKMEMWLEDETLNKPNGLWAENGQLLVGSRNSILKVDMKTKAISEFIGNTGGIDGLVSSNDGNYLITDWKGTTQLVSEVEEPVVLANTSDEKVNAADLDYDPDTQMFYIPTFNDNRVRAYRLMTTKPKDGR